MGTSSNLNYYCSRPSPKTRERERNDVIIYHSPMGEQTDVNAFTESTYAILEASCNNHKNNKFWFWRKGYTLRFFTLDVRFPCPEITVMMTRHLKLKFMKPILQNHTENSMSGIGLCQRWWLTNKKSVFERCHGSWNDDGTETVDEDNIHIRCHLVSQSIHNGLLFERNSRIFVKMAKTRGELSTSKSGRRKAGRDRIML